MWRVAWIHDVLWRGTWIHVLWREGPGYIYCGERDLDTCTVERDLDTCTVERDLDTCTVERDLDTCTVERDLAKFETKSSARLTTFLSAMLIGLNVTSGSCISTVIGQKFTSFLRCHFLPTLVLAWAENMPLLPVLRV